MELRNLTKIRPVKQWKRVSERAGWFLISKRRWLWLGVGDLRRKRSVCSIRKRGVFSRSQADTAEPVEEIFFLVWLLLCCCTTESMRRRGGGCSVVGGVSLQWRLLAHPHLLLHIDRPHLSLFPVVSSICLLLDSLPRSVRILIHLQAGLVIPGAVLSRTNLATSLEGVSESCGVQALHS